MKVAIIGVNSMVGARIIESFRLGDGPSVVAIARHPSQFALAARFAVDMRVVDTLEVGSLARSLAGCAAVIHVDHETADDARAPAILCRAAGKAGTRRVIYLSSAAVHGQNPPQGTDEKSPLHQRHAIAANNTLVAVEKQFFAECRQQELAGYALRPAVLYGPRSPLVARLVTEIQESRAWLLQNGEGICNSLYVDNLIAAIRLCLKARNGSGQPYLLTDSESVTWRDFYHALARELDLPSRGIHLLGDSAVSRTDDERPIGTTSAPRALPDPWDVPRTPAPEITPEMSAWQQCAWRLPSARANRELGYQPGVSFTEGIHRTCAWWRFAQGELAEAG